jgi:hypothetical protein
VETGLATTGPPDVVAGCSTAALPSHAPVLILDMSAGALCVPRRNANGPVGRLKRRSAAESDPGASVLPRTAWAAVTAPVVIRPAIGATNERKESGEVVGAWRAHTLRASSRASSHCRSC